MENLSNGLEFSSNRLEYLRIFALNLIPMDYIEISRQEEVVDASTGEVLRTLSTKSNVVKKRKTEGFCCLYDEGVAALSSLRSMSALKLMLFLCQHIDYDKGVIHLSRGLRQDACKAAGISCSSWYNAIKELASSHLISESGGVITVNARYLWRGTYQKRGEIIHLNDGTMST